MESFAAGISALGVASTVSSKPAKVFRSRGMPKQSCQNIFAAVAGEF